MPDKDLVKNFLPVIDKWLKFQTYSKEIPSVSVGIYFEDEVLFTNSYGYANLEEKKLATPQTMYRIASHSKLFTSTIIMKLYENGLLSIDDKVSKYLPWLPLETGEIRIRHLLTHSSGLTRDSRFGQWFHNNFPSKDDFIKAVNDENKIFEPNSFFKYSNIGFTLLGFIIETVTSQSFDQNITNLTKELNLQNTISDYSDEFIENHAIGYSRKLPHEPRTAFPQVPANSMSSATGLSSTVNDLLKFYQAHFLGNNKLFSDTYKRDMQQIHYVDSKKGIKWGFGFSHMNISKIPFIGHGGGYPGFITRSGFNQDKNLILVVLTNAIDGPALDLFNGIADLIYFALSNKDKFISKNKFPLANNFQGFYKNDWRIMYLQKVKDMYLLVNPLLPTISQSINILEQSSEHSFILPEGTGFDNAGEELLLLEKDGRCTIQQAGENLEQFEFTI